jgi:hypothetical protein
MTSIFRIVSVAIAMSAIAVTPQRLEAAPVNAVDRENARKLLNDGLDLRDEGKLDAALVKLQAADALVSTPVTRLEVGRTQMMLGKLVEARVTLNTVKTMAVAPEDEPKYAKTRLEAAGLADSIVPRLAAIRLVLKSPASVAVDGDPIPEAALTETRVVNPGPHVIAAKTGDGSTTTIEVTVQEGQTKDVVIELKPVIAAPTASKAPAPIPAAPVPADAPEPSKSLRTMSYLSLAVGAGCLGVASYLGLSARARYRAAEDEHCAGVVCDQNGVDATNAARRTAHVGTGFAIAGAALVVTGVILIVLPTASRSPKSVATISVGPAFLSLAGSF